MAAAGGFGLASLGAGVIASSAPTGTVFTATSVGTASTPITNVTVTTAATAMGVAAPEAAGGGLAARAAVSRAGQFVGGFAEGLGASGGAYVPSGPTTIWHKMGRGLGTATGAVIKNPEKTAAIIEFLRGAIGG